MNNVNEMKLSVKPGVVVLFFIALSVSFVSPHSSHANHQLSKREKLLAAMNRVRQSYSIPAVAVAVIRSDEFLEREIVGVRNMEAQDPARISDRFHLGSNTKNITSFVAAKLVEQGKIGWDTKFFELFPDMKNEALPCYHSITLRDLLSHRAFVPPYSFGGDYRDVPELSGDIHHKRVEFARHVLAQKPKKPWFKKYEYSNAGYVLAAAMLEQAGGRTWEELVSSVLHDDLDLEIGFGWPSQYGDDQPRGHMPAFMAGGKGFKLTPYEYQTGFIDDEVISPAGNVNISILDWSAYLQLHLKGLRGEDNYLRAETYEYLHFGLDDYSLGWQNQEQQNQTISMHDGSAGNFLTHVYIVKDQDLAVALMANSGATDLKTVMGVYDLRRKIVEIYLQ